MIELISISIFISVTLTVTVVLYKMHRRHQSPVQQIRKRVNAFSVQNTENKEQIPFILKKSDASRLPFLDSVYANIGILRKLRIWLEQSGSVLNVGQLLLIMLTLAIAGLVTTAQTGNQVMIVTVPPLLAAIPLIHIRVRRAKRFEAFASNFPDAIDMMVSALKAGLALNKSMQLVANESPDPVGIEFRKTFEAQNLGIPLEETLINFTRRIENLDLKLFVTAILMQRETGGNLTEILSNISHTIRERYKLKSQIKIYTAQGRLSAIILVILPVAFLLIISIINPSFIQPLFTEKAGRILLAIGTVLQIIGSLVIRKLIRIKLI